VPFGARLVRALQGVVPTEAISTTVPVTVNVYIGETELRGIVRTEVRAEDDATARVLLGGLA
jgi:hypothetical protein